MATQTTAVRQAARQSRGPQFFRFSIRHLLMWTAFVAVGCVALRSSSETWSGVLHAVSLLSLGAAILLLIYRQGAARAYWLGFALSGWLYVIILMYGWSLSREGRFYVPIEPDHLITSRLSIAAYQWSYTLLAPRPAPNYGGGGFGGGGGGFGAGGGFVTPPPPAFTGPPQHEFVNVAHALWTLLLAACGGCFAQWLYLTRATDEKRDAAPT